MANISYEQALAAYRSASEELYRRSETQAAERGAGLQAEAPASRGEALVEASRQLGDVLSDAVQSEEPDLRDLAGLKLLATAATDLAMANDLLEAVEQQEGIERSGSYVLSDPEVTAVIEMPLEGAVMQTLVVERAALPIDPAQARAALKEIVDQVVTEIPSDAADVTSRVVTGAVDFGLGPAKDLFSGAVDEIVAKLPDAVGWTLHTAARLIAEAIRKVWSAFGKKAQDEVQNRAQNWLKEVWNDGRLVSGLLQKLYQTPNIQTELYGQIKGASDQADFNGANRKCEELVSRYGKIKSILIWVLRAIGALKAPLLAAPPWGPVAAYTVYVAVLGYIVCSGGDYLDADWFQSAWLDHVAGVRTIVRAM
jgi:hypothetical protein